MARVTDEADEEVIRSIGAGKPLPEEYRFSYPKTGARSNSFWNSKTNELGEDGTTSVQCGLPGDRRRPSDSEPSSMSLIRSKRRVADHGEVFTPRWLVEKMLDLVKGETERIDSRFLEPACGSGNFLVPVLQRKLAAVEAKFGKSEFDRRHYALLAVMCTYGIELLGDNIAECRANILEIFGDYLNLNETDELYLAASYVLSQNLVHGNALTMRTDDGQPITFAEWGYLGKGKFQRRDFRLDVLTQMSSFSGEGALFAHLGKHEVFTPLKAHPPTTVRELACMPFAGGTGEIA